MTKKELFNDPEKVVTYVGHIPAEWIANYASAAEIMAGVTYMLSGHPGVKIVRIRDMEDYVIGYTRPSARRMGGRDRQPVYGDDVYITYKKRNTVDGRDNRLEHWVELIFNDAIDNVDYDGYLS